MEEKAPWVRRKEEAAREFKNYIIRHECSVCADNPYKSKRCNDFKPQKYDKLSCSNGNCSHGKNKHTIVTKVILGCTACDCEIFVPDPFVKDLCGNCKHINKAHTREIAPVSILFYIFMIAFCYISMITTAYLLYAIFKFLLTTHHFIRK